eukprot:6644442-Pyramimonas_sp.AAC.1
MEAVDGHRAPLRIGPADSPQILHRQLGQTGGMSNLDLRSPLPDFPQSTETLGFLVQETQGVRHHHTSRGEGGGGGPGERVLDGRMCVFSSLVDVFREPSVPILLRDFVVKGNACS